MGFELFTKFGRGHRPTCSIRSNGQIGLNQGAIRHLGLKDGYATIYYDKELKLIGIKPVENKDVEGATRLIVKSNNAFVSARSFLEFHAIPYREKTTTYDVEWNDEHQMIIVDLSKSTRRPKSDSKEID